ncbi:ATP-binding protein, partial [Candidatus Micrarchaeota archaeon]|nr:ATP-binding protein [Candidatus Micrarchaeota archaeon]
KESQIVSLCGLRRVGKTTILQKIIQDLLKENQPDSILYFSFDDFQDLELFDVLDGFKEIHQKEPRFLIFDEIQKLPNWAEKVKIFYDTKKYKIFISGSESLFLRKGSRESLAGRIYEFEVKKLSFVEYLNFVGKGEMIKKPQLYDMELKIELSHYLLTGGFPELIGKEDRELIRQYLKTAIIEKIVFKDMTKIYPIENPAQLIAILDILIDNPGMIVDFSSLSQELGISRQTLSKYFEYLEMAHLVVKLYNFSRNRITSEKSLKRFYPTFLSPVLIEESEEKTGKLIETTCVLATDTKFFWRDKYKDEVDIILQLEKEIIPVEIKYRNQPSQNKGLQKFCKKYKCKDAIVVTKDKRGKKEEVRFVPVYEFLLGF